MPSMVKAERVRSRISACQPWITSSFRKMVEVTLGWRARSGVTFGDAGSNEPRPEIVELSVVCVGTVLISAPLVFTATRYEYRPNQCAREAADFRRAPFRG